MVKALEQHKREAHDRRIPVPNSAEDLFGACKLGRARRRIARFGPSDSDALLTHGAWWSDVQGRLCELWLCEDSSICEGKRHTAGQLPRRTLSPHLEVPAWPARHTLVPCKCQRYSGSWTCSGTMDDTDGSSGWRELRSIWSFRFHQWAYRHKRPLHFLMDDHAYAVLLVRFGNLFQVRMCLTSRNRWSLAKDSKRAACGSGRRTTWSNQGFCCSYAESWLNQHRGSFLHDNMRICEPFMSYILHDSMRMVVQLYIHTRWYPARCSGRYVYNGCEKYGYSNDWQILCLLWEIT
jgi:hypothetical protein